MAGEDVVKSIAGEQQNEQEALKRLNDVFESCSFDLDGVFELKKAVYRHRALYGRLKDIVVQLTEKALAGESQNDPQALALGIAQWMLGRYSAAVEAFTGIRRGPVVDYLTGLCLKEGGAYGKALEILAKANERGDANPRIALLLVQVQAVMGNAQAASQTLKAVGSLRKPEAFYTQGFVFEMSGNYDGAAENYRKALELDPQHAESLFRLAYGYDLAGDDDTAIQLYKQCLKIEPSHSGVLINLGILCEDHGRYNEAIQYFERILADEPNNSRAKLYLRDAKTSLNMYYDEDKERKQDKRNRVMETPITDFELSVRSRNCLDLMGISSLGDLIRVTEPELLSYKNFGETSLNEIKTLLASKGLRLGQGLEEPKEPTEPKDEYKPEQLREVLSAPVSRLDLDRQTTDKLHRIGVDSWGELIHFSGNDLIKAGILNEGAVKEVSRKLAEHKLALKSA